ncbi:MAG TPA: S-methyl-5-thioribose-1-phosphate isomerase, partial [Burkholderiales bacterium]|nr:S-methyl-5-thioribose-1-phosphate isomerase [Burkholderiales bacterium]
MTAPAAQTVQTLRWRDARLELIDQRLLPARFEFVACGSADEVAEAIRSMVVRGAPAIGCAAAYGIALEALRLQSRSAADFATGLERGFAALSHSRPTAVNLFWALERMRVAWEPLRTEPPSEAATALLREAQAIHAEDIEANRRLGAHGAALIAD